LNPVASAHAATFFGALSIHAFRPSVEIGVTGTVPALARATRFKVTSDFSRLVLSKFHQTLYR
jgi:hypothetical protein